MQSPGISASVSGAGLQYLANTFIPIIQVRASLSQDSPAPHSQAAVKWRQVYRPFPRLMLFLS